MLLLLACTVDNGLKAESDSVCTVELGEGTTGGATDGCGIPTPPDWNLVELWSDLSYPSFLGEPMVAPIVDGNHDGVIDDYDGTNVVLAPDNGPITVYAGASGRIEWSVEGTGLEQTSPAIGDLDGDLLPEVVVAGMSATAAFRGTDGSTMWSVNPNGHIKPRCGATTIANLDGDGEPEVIVGRAILDAHTGADRGEGEWGCGSESAWVACRSVAADLDGDGHQEVVVGDAAYDSSGATVWHAALDDGFAAVADFDGDGQGEVVSSAYGSLALIDTNGTVLWHVAPFAFDAGAPVVADLDGDGRPEILQPTLHGVLAVDADGKTMWEFEGPGVYGWVGDGVSAYDLDGDGAWEVIDESSDALRILNGRDGAVLAEWPHEDAYVCGAGPAVADVDGDGHVEIVIGVSGDPGGVVVLQDSAGFAPGRRVWNQESYAITNVGDEGAIPPYPTSNWPTYNSFRAGAPPEFVTEANLFPIVDDICCGEAVSMRIGNDGDADFAGDVEIEVGGTTRTWTGWIPAGGTSEGIEVPAGESIRIGGEQCDGGDDVVAVECE